MPVPFLSSHSPPPFHFSKQPHSLYHFNDDRVVLFTTFQRPQGPLLHQQRALHCEERNKWDLKFHSFHLFVRRSGKEAESQSHPNYSQMKSRISLHIPPFTNLCHLRTDNHLNTHFFRSLFGIYFHRNSINDPRNKES